MIEWEKRNNISVREKKTKRKRKRANLDKENCRPPDAEKKKKKKKKLTFRGKHAKKSINRLLMVLRKSSHDLN